MSNWAICENKANSNPIKANFPTPRGQIYPIQTNPEGGFVLIRDEIKCIIKDVKIACLITISFFEKMGRDK